MKYLRESSYAGNKFKEPFVPYGNQTEEQDFDDNNLTLGTQINTLTE